MQIIELGRKSRTHILRLLFRLCTFLIGKNRLLLYFCDWIRAMGQTVNQQANESAVIKAGVMLIVIFTSVYGQVNALAQVATGQIYSHEDSLRGMLTPLRSCYDVFYYSLDIKLDVKKRSITGSNQIHYLVSSDFDSLQIDLSRRLKVEKIVFQGVELPFRREADAVFVKYPKTQSTGSKGMLECYYSGSPIVAKSPPWDGGFVWKKDLNGNDWIGVACEGTGASVWWPCKDHLSDEPDSMEMTFKVPAGLMCVSNGNLRKSIVQDDGTTAWRWFVSYPINNYNVTVNLAHYTHFTDQYIRETDTLALDYYVLTDNRNQAEPQFLQVNSMLACFEEYFGNYPFEHDGFALVETNYWGMEHQGAIAYGNNYVNNKWGFDYIIIHESAHEWWGNSVSCTDMANLWIHESFATYAEALYVECMQGKQAATDYLISQRWNISDKSPIIGPMDVNYKSSDNDLYYKGSWMLHTLRNVLGNDSLFFVTIKNIQLYFKYKTVTTDELIKYINLQLGRDFTGFFDQYLRHASPPILEYRTSKKGMDTKLEYRWKVDVDQFWMPVEVVSSYSYSFGKISKSFIRIEPGNQWKSVVLHNLNPEDFDVNTDLFYVKKIQVK